MTVSCIAKPVLLKEVQNMLIFKPIALEDRGRIDPIIRAYDSKSCDCSFVNSFIWSHVYSTEFAIANGFYCIRSGKKPFFYTNPIGNGDYKAIVMALMADARARGIPFTLRGLLKEDVERLSGIFPDTFDIAEKRNEHDYIYGVKALTDLAGRKYAGKRNHIARFMDNPDWSYEPISETNMPECSEMNDEWCRRNGCKGEPDLAWERCAVRKSMRYFSELKLSGGLLRLNGKVIAFTIGEPLSSDTYNIHVEKAFSEIQGAYPMINRQFLIHNCQPFRYVNREEDTGDEGLRKAKLSYHPEFLLEKYTATLREGKKL